MRTPGPRGALKKGNLNDLEAGIYELCLTNDRFPNYKQCYNLNIQEPVDLSVLSSINRESNQVSLNMSGSENYNIILNGELIKTYKDKLNKMSSKGLQQKSNDYINRLKKISDNHKFVTDKMPHNFVLIGFIKILFPNAKIIYCQRDKMDNCFSLFAHKFMDKSHGYCYNQKTLGKYYDLHLELMAYWLDIFKEQIYVLNHEKLVNDQEKYSRELVDYCSLEWDPNCLEFYNTKRDVLTASNEQVREPINKKSFAAWKKYSVLLEQFKK